VAICCFACCPFLTILTIDLFAASPFASVAADPCGVCIRNACTAVGDSSSAHAQELELEKVIALVNALAKLHNLCIDKKARADTVDLTLQMGT
jgi:hypothetical protein